MNEILNRSLCKTYANFFPIGAAVCPKVIKSHRELLLKHFNTVSCENHMKFINIHPEEKKWDFSPADEIVDFAVANRMKVRGHTLIWHNQVPNWVFLDNKGNEVNRDVLLDRMEEHITIMMQRYKKQVYCWDVVNEAAEDKGADIFRQSKWYKIIGPDFIERAFEFARKADPDAILFYNDYNCTAPEKSKKIYNIAKRLKDHGNLIDGIGMQGHWNIYNPSFDRIMDTIDLFSSLGLKIQITELDMSMYLFEDATKEFKQPTDEMIWLQQERFEGIFKIFRDYRDIITGVTFWGVADDYTWLDNFPVKGRKDWPLLFDIQHKPKKAFASVVNFD
ncbi:MAG: Endo-1,4-beta-xylanase B [Planctomycetes bacterium ADurb.Bin401]|nr:MAG: Endo-1,4-beta-xylanase B [Planctomycetes bacterium ADurb.Bin401]